MSLNRSEMAPGEKLEVKVRARLGPEKSVRTLNRIAEWCPEGIRCEAYQRHVEEVARAWPGGE